MSGRLWTRDTIVGAIKAEAFRGHQLNYSSVQSRVPSLLRAAERVFGSWSAAVEAAGFDYSAIRRYRMWSQERVIETIRTWHQKGADLSWRHVATKLDPSLAAAALHARRFTCWSDALAAAGLDPEEVARYRRWSLPIIEIELERLAIQGVSLDQETLDRVAPDLRAAIYRIEGGIEAQHRALQRQLAEQRKVLRIKKKEQTSAEELKQMRLALDEKCDRSEAVIS
ncbi:MAG TPA: hypothetical protein VHV83_14110 [Armatimonadota bacterium]|nr:hypothetical protein [Armatimonadota bacterium]